MIRRILAVAALLAVSSIAAAQPSGLIINGEGSAAMTWVLPTQFEDGSPLPAAQRAGYVLFYGNQSRFESGTSPRAMCVNLVGGQLRQRPAAAASTECYGGSTTINNGSQTSTTLTLPLNQSTTIYFAATTLTTSGAWSNYSNEAAKIFTLEIEDVRIPNAPVIESINVNMTCTTNDPGFTCRFTVQ